MNVEWLQEAVWDANLQLVEILHDPDSDVSREAIKLVGRLAQEGR
jgi:hypothetical protein